MALTLMEEDMVKPLPDMGIAQLKFSMQMEGNGGSAADKAKLLEEMKKHNMVEYYKTVAKELGWAEDGALVAEMEAKRKEKEAELQQQLENAEKNEGETEIKDALLAKAEYLVEMGDKKAALEATAKTLEKTVGCGNRLDLVFMNIRLGLFFMDHAVIRENMDKAKQMIEEGGDWDRRNRLKVYEALYAMSVRDFARAAKLFLETVSTFTSYELMDYKKFVVYTVYAGMIALDRGELLEKVVRGSEIQEVRNGKNDFWGNLFNKFDLIHR